MSELVGDAYVRIHADTKFMHDAIERDMKKAGKGGADSLIANFDKTLKETARTRLRAAQHSLADAIVGGDFDALLKKSNLSIEQFVDKIAVDLARIQDVGKFKGLEDAFEELDNWAERAMIRREADNIADALDRDHQAAIRLNATFKEQERIGQSLADRFEALDTKAWRTDIQTLTRDLIKHNEALDAAEDAAHRLNEEMKKTGKVETHRTFSGIRNSLHELNADLDKFSASGGIGRVFGKGSRNDFLNFVGSAVGGITKLAEGLLRLPITLVDKFTNGLGSMIDQFKDLRAAGATIPEIIGGAFASGIKTGGLAIAAMVVALAGLAVVLPTVVSLASALLGGLTAAAGALYFAIAGTLLPLVPIAAGLAAALGPLALGVIAITKGIKDQSKSVANITGAWKDFRKATQPFVREFTAEVDKMAGGLNGLLPFFSDMGDAVIGFMQDLRQAFTTPEMAKFIEDWETTLPIVFDNVGRAISQLLAGITAFFTPILPFAERLSAKFEDLATTFNNWASSKPGQNSIKDFMEKAFDAADTLWHILGNVVTALHNIFDIGQEDAGKSLLDKIDELTTKFKEFTEAPEGQESIRDWFTRAKEAGDKLFTIVGQLFTFFQTLDTEQASEDLNNFLTAMKGIGEFAETFAGAIQAINTVLNPSEFHSTIIDFLVGLREPLGLTNQGMFEFGENLRAHVDAIGEQLDRIPGIFQINLAALPGIVAGLLVSIPNLMSDPWSLGVTLIGGALGTLPAHIVQWLGNIPALAAGLLAVVVTSLPAPFRQAITAIVGVLTGGPSAIASGMGGWVGAAAGAVAGIYTTLTQPFRDAISYIRGILSDIGAAASRVPGVSQLGDLIRNNAAGGILYGPTMVGPFDRAGEAGREALVPLDRPLSMIDPSVRALAAFAQGKVFTSGSGGKSTTVMPGAISVVVPNSNPVAVAEAVLDRFVTAGAG